MSNNIYERDAIRIKVLVGLYNRLDGDIKIPFDFIELGNEFDIDKNETLKVYSYFIEEGYVEPYGSGYTSTLTHHGLKSAESFIRRIDFNQQSDFDSTEIYQLRVMLDEIKGQISKLDLGQEVIFNRIDEAFEESKIKTKKDWKDYFEGQIKDWTTQKVINQGSKLVMESLLVGLKVSS